MHTQNYRQSLSNLLILLSFVVTCLSFVVPAIGDYGMNRFFLFNGDAIGVVSQFLLYQFLHADILHLAANSIFLYIFGNQVELLMGRSRYVTFFTINTLFGGVCIFLLSSGNTIGISGFTLALLAYIFLELRSRNDPEYRAAGMFLLINVAMGLTENTSFVGHFAGALLGLGFYAGEKILRRR